MVHDLQTDILVELSCLFACMVTFSDRYLNDTMSVPLQKVTKALPDIVNKFAEGSRMNKGERLKKRALRHALDPAVAPLDYRGTGTIIQYQEKVGLLLAHTMSPSYHQDVIYHPVAAFTIDDLLAASDDSECKAGPTVSCRHICVHILPLLLLLTLLLFDGLAEHYLVELAERWHQDDENKLRAEQKSKMIAALNSLAVASGAVWKQDTVGYSGLASCNTVSLLLQQFLVGTERRKSRSHGVPPKPAETKPFRDYCIVNPAKIMQQRTVAQIGMPAPAETAPAPAESATEVVEPTGEPIDNGAMQCTIDALAKVLGASASDLDGFAGYKLLRYRYDLLPGMTVEMKSLLEKAACHNIETILLPATSMRKRNYHQSAESALAQMADTATTTATTTVVAPCRKKTIAVKVKRHFKCIMHGGRCPGSTVPLGWRRVPPLQPAVSPSDSNTTRETKARKRFCRMEVLRRAGQNENSTSDGWRICPRHSWVQVKKSFAFEEISKDGQPRKRSKTHTFLVPDNAGISSEPKTLNKGRGEDRFIAKVLLQSKENSWAQTTQQVSELRQEESIDDVRENLRRVSEMNPNVRQMSGLDQYSAPELNDTSLTDSQPEAPVHHLPEPVVSPESISDAEIKARTGFISLFAMLSFVLIVCNGKINTAIETVSSLTWFEEWMVYFQWLWGRENITEESLAMRFKTSRRTLVGVLTSKLELVLAARKRWPMFASFEEDIALQRQRWSSYYFGKRKIMWDDTNVNAPDPQDAETNCHWFSHYYGSCVAKGAVFLQLCGWMGTWELWAGCISDSDYQVRAGILAFMAWFVSQDPLHSDIPFLSILDKGYRIVLAAW